MADDIKIVIDVDDSDVVQAIKNHQILEKRVESLKKEYTNLDKALNKNKISAQDYAKGIQQVDKQIAHLEGTLRKGGKAVADMATGMNFSGKATRRFELGVQQAGYQIGDFVVQVQSGANPLVAFSQQASQLAGFFAGPWGAMIGLGISVLAGLGMAFLSAEEDAKHLRENLDKIGESLKDFQDKVSDAEETVSSFSYAMSQVQNTQIKAAWEELGNTTAGAFEASFMAKLGSFLGANLWSGFATWGDVSGRLAGENFAKAFGTSSAVLGPNLLDQIGEAVKDKNVDILDSMIKELSAFSAMTTEGAAFLEYLIKIRDESDGITDKIKKLAEKVEEAKDSGKDLTELDIAFGIGEAAKVAELLAEKLGISLEHARSLVNVASKESGVGVTTGTPLYKQGMYDSDLGIEQFFYTPDVLKGKKKSGGADARQTRLDALLKSLMTEQEQVENWRTTQLDLLSQYNEKELALVGGQAEAKLRLEAEYSSRLAELKVKESQLVTNSSKSMYSELAGLLDMFAGKSKAAAIASIAITKGLRIAEIVSSGAAAQVRAIAELGPILGPPAAAKIAAFTKVQAGIVAATGLMQAASAVKGSSGSLSGSPSGADATVATAATAAPQRVIIEGIDRNSLISGEQLSSIFDALYKENKDRGFVFEVAR